jgi:hypothetical protein
MPPGNRPLPGRPWQGASLSKEAGWVMLGTAGAGDQGWGRACTMHIVRSGVGWARWGRGPESGWQTEFVVSGKGGERKWEGLGLRLGLGGAGGLPGPS